MLLSLKALVSHIFCPFLHVSQESIGEGKCKKRCSHSSLHEVLPVIFLCLLPHPHLFTPIGKQASATPAIHCAFGIRNWASPWKEKERGPPTWWMVVQGKKALSNSTAAADRCSITFFLFNQNFFLMLPIIFTLQAKLLKFFLHSYIIAVRRV